MSSKEKVHETLYDVIHVLTHTYPTSKDFDQAFKTDMFVKNNKAAFQHVVHYLLNILSPDETKTTLTAWPIYEPRMEHQFRKQVCQILNHVADEYKDYGLPRIVASQLVNPGGMKFARYMMKFASLVLHRELEKDGEEEILPPLRSTRNKKLREIRLKHMKEKKKLLKKELADEMAKLEEVERLAVEEAGAVKADMEKTSIKLREAKTELELMSRGAGDNQTPLEMAEKTEKLKEMVHVIDEIASNCSKKDDSQPNIIEYDRAKLQVPQSLSILIETNGKLDLLKLFKTFTTLLDEFQPENTAELSNLLLSLNTQLEQGLDVLKLQKQEFHETAAKLKTLFQHVKVGGY